MANPVTTGERGRIVELLREGKSQGVTAREVGRSKQTVSRIARAEGIQSDVTATKKAEEARLAYSEERRLELIGKGFKKADELLEALADAGEFQKWTVGLGTLVDKARLETGEATNRTESVDPTRRQKMRESLDEIAAQRRKRVAGDT